MAGATDCTRPEETLLEFKSKILDLEKLVQSCRKKLKKFQSDYRETRIEQDKKFQKLTSRLRSMRLKFKEGKSKFSVLEKKLDETQTALSSVSTAVRTSEVEHRNDKANCNQVQIRHSKATKPEKKRLRKEKDCKDLEVCSKILRNVTFPALRNPDDGNPTIFDGEEKESTESDMEIDSNSSSNETYRCNQCENIFNTPVALKIHNLHICSKGTDLLGCPICPEYFDNKILLHDHLSEHELEKANITTSLETNEVAVTKDPKYQCVTCSKVFTDPSSFRRHLNFVHPEAASHYCGKCQKVFSTLVGLRNHEASASHKKKTCNSPMLYTCDKCGYFSRREDTHHTHVRKCGRGENSYQCQHCGSSFPNRFVRGLHCRQKHPEFFQHWVCRVCSRGFKEANKVKAHEKLHLKPSSHRCPHCKFYFVKQMDILEHVSKCKYLEINKIRNSHSLSKQSAIKSCNTSAVSPGSPSGMAPETVDSAHVQLNAIGTELDSDITVHQATSAPTSRKSVQNSKALPVEKLTCKICEKSYSCKSSLTRHEKSHNKAIKFSAKK